MRSERVKEGPLDLQRGGEEKSGEREGGGRGRRKRNEGGRGSRPRVTTESRRSQTLHTVLCAEYSM
jgi:hypothetical protein